MSPHERLAGRYARLLLAYPREYRRTRGPEVIGTLLDLARPGQAWPGLADAADLLGAGVRVRGAGWSVRGIGDGARIAAPTAVALAAGMAVFLGTHVEPTERTAAPAAYLIWALAAAGWLTARPRPMIAAATVASAATPFIAGVVGLGRPPLWVTMSLTGFGVIAVAGTGGSPGRRTWEDRLPVPLGAAVVALAATLSAGGSNGYYWPTVGVVSAVVGLGVAATAAVGLHRLALGRPAAGWMWATLLLALPGGWLGPTGGDPAHHTVTSAHFGHLAEVTLATTIGVCAYAWFGRPPRPRTVAGLALGAAAGLTAGASFTGALIGNAWLVATIGALVAVGVAIGTVGGVGGADRSGTLGGAGEADRSGTVAGAGEADRSGTVAGAGGADRSGTVGPGVGPAATAAALAATLALTPLIGAYDNDWIFVGWLSPRSTMLLVSTIALVPLALGGLTAWRVIRDHGRRGPAAIALVVAAAWCGRMTLPHLLRWGVALLVLVAVAVIGASLVARRRPGMTGREA